MFKIMRILFQPETLNKLPSRSQEKNRSCEDILIVGQPLQIPLKNLAPSENVIVSLKSQGELELYSEADQPIDTQTLIPINQVPTITLLARTFSDRPNDRSLEITFQDEAGYQLSQVQLKLTCLRICLDVDADRDGIVDDNNPQKGDWQWGINGHGAILMVNTDRDHVHSDNQYDRKIKGLLDLKDSSFMIIRRAGLRNLPSGCEIHLSVSENTAKRICIYDELDKSGYELISPKRTKAQIRGTDQDILLAIRGLSYPDIDFDGRVEITLNLVKDGETLYSDRVVFRVAPWMMTPNTLSPITVFVSRLSKGKNEDFIEELRKVVAKANAQLDPVPEVSPPVTVKGVNYPFGRLLFGGTRPEIIPKPRRKLKVFRDFFFAQKIQAPFEIFSDWLSVGHIDEFMNFVPAPNPKRFKLALASPDKCYDLLKGLRSEGHSQALLRQSKQIDDKPADISVADVLENENLARQNQRFQEHISWNREVLKQELDLGEEDIIDLPVLFENDGDGRAKSFFPNMVNMLVLKQHLAIPKPFGPQVDAQCQFEAYVKGVLEPWSLVCHFIDDWDTYFRDGGEIHCGTNTSRQPFTQKWWEIEPMFLE